MTPATTRRSILAAALAAAGSGTLAACSVPGSGGPAAAANAYPGGRITAPVTAKQAAARGRTTLRIVADSGEQQFLRQFVPLFEKQYPSVHVSVTTKAFTDFAKTIVNTMSGANPPDLIQGNQGYGVDGLLVRSNLLRPLDDIAHAYGWDLDFPSGATGQYRWSPDGLLFGTGNLYGISQSHEFVGVFYNRTLLQQLKLQVPATLADLEHAMDRAHAHGLLPVVLGNADQYPGEQLLGTVQALRQPVAESRAWIDGVPGTTFATDADRSSADTIRSWARRGRLGSGFNGLSADDAVTRFTAGKGVFLIAGTWNAPAVRQGLGRDGGFTVLHDEHGRTAAAGSFGLPWHISSRTRSTEAAVAFLGMMQGPVGARTMAEVGRLPVRTEGVPASGPLAADQLAAGARLLADDGQTYYFDWASQSMMATIGAATQDLLTGRLATDAYLQKIQADWTAFQSRQAAEARRAARPGKGAGQ